MLERKVAVAVCATTIGLAMTSTASFANEKQGIVTVSTLNIRSGPSTSYAVITKVHKNDKLEILESSNGWHKVKLSNGKIGWGSGAYISTSSNPGDGSSSEDENTPSIAKTGITTTSVLNIRSGPSTSHSVIAKSYKGDKVEILESSNGWYKVKLSNGKIGWGSGYYISTSSNPGDESSSEDENTPSTGETGAITTSVLNIRSGPSTSYSVITKSYKGDKVEILESSNGWYKVKLSNGKIGWGSGHYISTSSNPGDESSSEDKNTPSIGETGTITTSELNIRSGPSTSYSVITKSYKGDKVEILESSNGWYKVKLSNGKIGWGSGYYISTSSNPGDESSSEDESTPQDKAQAIVNLAKAQLGKPYVWGAEGPDSFDCSGLTYYVYGKNGIKLPRVSRDQYSAGTSVSLSNLKPGDLLFSSTNGSGNITHVGIYIGNGEMIHSPKPGEVVQKANINSSYWQKAHVGAKRVL